MQLSVVTGTYNRISYLQSMIESVRRSFENLIGFKYEIVVVDGGSSDGSINWCKSQPDVALIEHGKLLGAVKAFNDGAFSAKGDYVILANDDIEFIADSVLKAYVYMQKHSDCGIGCFYQDRNRQNESESVKWHVEGMPCIRDGRQIHASYGQVCIVPKWLGDSVGWWGDYLHTYGGDNEISSMIYETGFKVSPIPETKITDKTPNDELRKINNINGGTDPRAVRGHHPDSWAWGRKWRQMDTGLVGPVIRDDPIYENPLTANHRFLYLPIFEQGWDIQKTQKRGLRDALSKHGMTREVDYIGINLKEGKDYLLQHITDLILQIDPTIILTQLHNEGVLNADDIRRLKSLSSAKFVNWNGDYWPENLLSEEGIKLARAFDLQTVINRQVLDEYAQLGIDAAYWQIGWEPDGIGHKAETPLYDVVFLGNGYSSERQRFVKQVRTLRHTFGLYGHGWPEGWSNGSNLYNFSEACKVYRGAKISLGDSQWPETGFVSNRIFQALAAGGSALAHQWFNGMDELGLVDGETIIVWSDFAELEDKLQYYLTNENDRLKIAEAGEKLALENHSFDNRVSELLMMIDEPQKEENWRW